MRFVSILMVSFCLFGCNKSESVGNANYTPIEDLVKKIAAASDANAEHVEIFNLRLKIEDAINNKASTGYSVSFWKESPDGKPTQVRNFNEADYFMLNILSGGDRRPILSQKIKLKEKRNILPLLMDE